MKTAIVGLPMVGKSSLFTILTGVHEATRMGSMEVRVGVAKVPDPRLTALAAVFQPPKITHATVEYLDTPSISKESLRDTGLLASLRVADAFAHVLRVFESDTVPHEKGNVDPVRDADDLDIELILSDLVVVEKRIERVEKDRKKQRSAELDREIDLLNRCKAALEDNRPLRTLEISAEEEKIIRGFQFLSQKPMLYVLNVGEEDAGKMHAIEEEYRTTKLASRPGTGISAICGKIEAELAELSADDAKEMMETYGLTEPGLNRLIERTYDLLGLMSFLTAGETEVRAWTIPKNCTAQKAAGAIHSDFEKKFIRAESVNWKDLVDHNGYAGLRGTPLLRLEGKEYIVEDGDVLVIRHS
ncbi:MAG: redox-regulated ATPase YchF [Acidobacteria bacterium]|nr:redox-regulated ATPase YchF [Acidobacteriota bacterium]